MKNILNYQGNKKSLLQFISSEMNDYLIPNKYLLDIFAGSGSVSIFYGDKTNVAYNDMETYSQNIISAYLQRDTITQRVKSSINGTFLLNYTKNYFFLSNRLSSFKELEERFLKNEDIAVYTQLEKTYPTIWNHMHSMLIDNQLFEKHLELKKKSFFALFTTYYANTYFGIKQTIEIDSIRYAIEFESDEYKPLLFTALYYAMNNCVFSKDGHMAQPLSINKYLHRCILKRRISIKEAFDYFLENFCSINSSYKHIGFCENFTTLIADKEFMKNVGCIYADPPYTDMQYSRYYHLLNTITWFTYPAPTIQQEHYTKGLYLNNRQKSVLSCKSTCLNSMITLMEQCKKNHINLVVSFGYPEDETNQKTDRYVMTISELVNAAKSIFSERYVSVKSNEYTHANQRNSARKPVYEYLILCRGSYND